jgi:hypothetical protein
VGPTQTEACPGGQLLPERVSGRSWSIRIPGSLEGVTGLLRDAPTHQGDLQGVTLYRKGVADLALHRLWQHHAGNNVPSSSHLSLL